MDTDDGEAYRADRGDNRRQPADRVSERGGFWQGSDKAHVELRRTLSPLLKLATPVEFVECPGVAFPIAEIGIGPMASAAAG